MAKRHKYQVGLLGKPGGTEKRLLQLIRKGFKDLGIRSGLLSVLRDDEISDRDRKAPFVLIYFGSSGPPSAETLQTLDELLEDSVPIFPCVDDLTKFNALVPSAISAINGLDLSKAGALEHLTGFVLQAFRLLRTTRRLFISYRRSETQAVAIQLYEELDQRNFDVFLDTHSVAPGEPFQEVLWHRLADTDVVILLDSPGFQERRWTMDELAQANATTLQVLQLLWPDQKSTAPAAFSQFFPLSKGSFEDKKVSIGPDARLKKAAVDKICAATESLRARALAARYRNLVDYFCDTAWDMGMVPVVQQGRFIEVAAKSGAQALVIPAVGIPDAVLNQNIEVEFQSQRKSNKQIWLLYDERGVRNVWQEHLAWLNQYAPVQCVQVAECEAQLRGL